MRPKKRILVVGASEDRVGVLRFTLETHAYATTAAYTAEAALEILGEQYFDVLICGWPLDGIEALLRDARANHPAVRTMILAPTAVNLPISEMPADATLCKASYGMAYMLERLKYLAARTPGPAKKLPAVAQAAIPTTDWRVA
jgi:DNA-binding response OmpR family regulator